MTEISIAGYSFFSFLGHRPVSSCLPITLSLVLTRLLVSFCFHLLQAVRRWSLHRDHATDDVRGYYLPHQLEQAHTTLLTQKPARAVRYWQLHTDEKMESGGKSKIENLGLPMSLRSNMSPRTRATYRNLDQLCIPLSFFGSRPSITLVSC